MIMGKIIHFYIVFRDFDRHKYWYQQYGGIFHVDDGFQLNII